MEKDPDKIMSELWGEMRRLTGMVIGLACMIGLIIFGLNWLGGTVDKVNAEREAAGVPVVMAPAVLLIQGEGNCAPVDSIPWVEQPGGFLTDPKTEVVYQCAGGARYRVRFVRYSSGTMRFIDAKPER
jgi:hypothetical protein